MHSTFIGREAFDVSNSLSIMRNPELGKEAEPNTL